MSDNPTEPYAVCLNDGYYAALQCRDPKHAAERGHTKAEERGTTMRYIRKIVDGIARQVVWGKV